MARNAHHSNVCKFVLDGSHARHVVVAAVTRVQSLGCCQVWLKILGFVVLGPMFIKRGQSMRDVYG